MEDGLLYVCLGNWMDEFAQLNSDSSARVDLLSELLNHKPADVLLTGWPYRSDCSTSIARAMEMYLRRIYHGPSRIFIDETARDTVGDAVCTRLWIDRNGSYKKINVVTSQYHVARTEEIFRFVFNTRAQIEVFGAGAKYEPEGHDEEKSLAAFRRTFDSVEAGDMRGMLNRLLTLHPFYNGDVYPAIKYDRVAGRLVDAKLTKDVR